jgi:hypothetical protein
MSRLLAAALLAAPCAPAAGLPGRRAAAAPDAGPGAADAGPRMEGQPLISVDGTPAVEVSAPGLDLSGGLAPRFEPKGGFAKAAFFEWDPGRMGLHSVIGNANGSGDWLRLPNGADCLEWQGHTALCFNGNLYAVRGEQAGLLAREILPQGVKGLHGGSVGTKGLLRQLAWPLVRRVASAVTAATDAPASSRLDVTDCA